MAILTSKHLNWQLVVLLLTLPTVRLQSSYSSHNVTDCAKETLNAKTIFEFWQENSQGCALEAGNLYKIHKKISLTVKQQNHDKITDLIGDHISSSLMETLFNQLIAAISTKSLTTKPKLEKVINQLYNEQDKSFIHKLWHKVFEEALLFISVDEVLEQILLLTNGDLKLYILEYFINKYEEQYKDNEKFLPLLTFGVASVLNQRQQTKSTVGHPDIGRLLSKLPEQLLTTYQSWNYNVSLLNRHYKEYIFPERNNVPSANKRYLFNFLPSKNYYRVKGKFKLQFNPKGLLTLGAPYDNSYKYLSAEEKSAFICLDCAIEAAQWWQVLWPNDDQQYLLLQNIATQELLCSTSTMYNENFVLISTLDLAQHKTNSLCQWKVVKRDK